VSEWMSTMSCLDLSTASHTRGAIVAEVSALSCWATVPIYTLHADVGIKLVVLHS